MMNVKTNAYTNIDTGAEDTKMKGVDVNINDGYYNELKILSFLDHSFIVKTDGFAQDERYLYIVMELVNGGELFTELRKAMKFKIEQAT